MAIKFFSQTFLCLSFFFFLACGRGGNGGGSSQRTSSEEQQEYSKQLYRAVLKPMNVEASGRTSGVVIVRIEHDEFVVDQTVTEASNGVRHYQAIMSGSSCEAQDENQDGYVDLPEGMKAFGRWLIPLDSNLGSQLEGMDYGPIANAENAYIYRRTASFVKLLSDLTAQDPDEDDDLVKISGEINLRLRKRVVVVFGSDRSLPETVLGSSTYSASEGIPIACGALEPINDEILPIE
jgi:hypothetical protein